MDLGLGAEKTQPSVVYLPYAEAGASKPWESSDAGGRERERHRWKNSAQLQGRRAGALGARDGHLGQAVCKSCSLGL